MRRKVDSRESSIRMLLCSMCQSVCVCVCGGAIDSPRNGNSTWADNLGERCTAEMSMAVMRAWYQYAWRMFIGSNVILPAYLC